MDKVLVITGGSRGIGLATLKLFAKTQYRVINISRSNTDTSCASQITADFQDPNWVTTARKEILEQVGEADQITLIHNAALLVKDSLEAAAAFSKVMQINLLAPQQLNEILLPKMNPGSSILYVGSTLSHKAVANTLSYSSSKHGVLGLMRATCQDLIGKGIHTACICPGFTDTEMLRDHIGQDAEILKALGEGNGFGRLVQPQEIADSLKFCAENPAINGTALDVHLGQIEH